MLSLSPLRHGNSADLRMVHCLWQHYSTRWPWSLIFWPLNRLTGYSWWSSILPRPFSSRVRSRHATDRQTDRHRPSFDNARAVPYGSQGQTGWVLLVTWAVIASSWDHVSRASVDWASGVTAVMKPCRTAVIIIIISQSQRAGSRPSCCGSALIEVVEGSKSRDSRCPVVHCRWNYWTAGGDRSRVRVDWTRDGNCLLYTSPSPRD